MAKTPDGIRGPGGPPPRPGSRGTGRPSSGTRGSGPRPRPDRAPTSSTRAGLERRSYPAIMALTRVPKWLVVVLMAVCLFLGLIQSGGLAWLGAILLGIVAVFLGWLLALSWPVLGPGSRLVRLVTVIAVIGIAVLKAMGRF